MFINPLKIIFLVKINKNEIKRNTFFTFSSKSSSPKLKNFYLRVQKIKIPKNHNRNFNKSILSLIFFSPFPFYLFQSCKSKKSKLQFINSFLIKKNLTISFQSPPPPHFLSIFNSNSNATRAQHVSPDNTTSD